MQKVVKILEEYVQWIAIGLGVLFCGLMLWSYVLQPPAKVTIGSSTLTAGDVDPETLEKVATPLQTAMQNTQTIKVPVPHYVDAFKATMGWEKADAVALNAGSWMDSQAQDVPLPQQAPQPGALPPGANPQMAGGNNAGAPGGVQAVPVGKVAALPVIPPPVPDQTKFGRSVVLLPAANGQPAPQPQPVVPGQPVPGGVDKDWVTALFKLNLDGLAQSIKQAQVPQLLQKVTFLQVEMEREELDAAGNPIPNTRQVIAPLPTWRTNQPPPPWPGEGIEARQAQAMYLQWAATNTPDILQPVFYATVKGEPWTKPGAQVQQANLVFDPSTYTGALTVPPLTKEQREAVMNYRRAAQKAKDDAARQRTKAAPRSPAGGAGGRPDMEGSFAPERVSYAVPPPQPARPPVPVQPRVPVGGGVAAPYGGGAGYGRMAPGMVPPDLEGGDMGGGYPGGGGAVAPGLPVPGTDYPTGEYDINDPKWQGKTIEIWANDDTVQAGKTYHYHIRYKIKNPIFLQRNIVNNVKLADQFAIASDWSAWTTPVQVPPLVNFFVANSKSPQRNTVRFQVFRWDQGEEKSELFEVGPGDQVGGVKNGIDFSTDWTVVDFREDARQNDTQVLLVNNKDGSIIVRSYRADSNDPLYNNLKQQLQPAAGTAAAGTPGTIPPVPGPRASAAAP